MAMVNGVIVGTNEPILVNLPTVRIPELPEQNEAIEDDDSMAVYDKSLDSTRWRSMADLRSYFFLGSDSDPVPPVLQGGDLEIVATTENISGSNRVLEIALQNKTYSLSRVGYGQLLTSQFSILPSGGFELLDDNVRVGDIFFAHIYSQTTENPGGGTGGGTSLINGVALIADDTTLNTTHNNKLLHISNTVKNLVITLQDIMSTPANMIVCMETTISNGFFVKVQTQGGQNIYFGGSAVSNIWLGSNEYLWLLRGVDGWYVMKASEGIMNVGIPFFGYKERINSKVLKGQLVAKTSCPRIVEWLASTPDAVVSETDWQNSSANKGKFTYFDANTIRFPDYQNHFIRGLNNIGGSDAQRPGNTVGLRQADMVGPHVHKLLHGRVGGITNDANGGGWGNYGTNSIEEDLVKVSDGVETRGKNIGLLPFINI